MDVSLPQTLRILLSSLEGMPHPILPGRSRVLLAAHNPSAHGLFREVQYSQKDDFAFLDYSISLDRTGGWDFTGGHRQTDRQPGWQLPTLKSQLSGSCFKPNSALCPHFIHCIMETDCCSHPESQPGSEHCVQFQERVPSPFPSGQKCVLSRLTSLLCPLTNGHCTITQVSLQDRI